MKTTIVIKADSTTMVESNPYDLRVNLSQPLRLEGDLEEYRLILVKAEVPYESANISAALGNTTLSYNYDGTDYDIEFPDGIYQPSDISSTISANLIANGSYITDSYGVDHNVFELKWNYAISKSYFKFYDSTTYPATITFAGSTFYSVIGFAADDSITATTLASSIAYVDQGQAQISIVVNICSSNVNEAFGVSNELYAGVWNSSPHGLSKFPTADESANPTFARITSKYIDKITVQIQDSTGSTMTAMTSNTPTRYVFIITDE